MKRIALIPLMLAVILSASSCSMWFTTPKESDSIEDPYGLKTDTYDTEEIPADVNTQQGNPLDELLGENADGLPSIDSPRLEVLGENLEFYRIEEEQCVVVYNTENAWMFDYKLNRVTPLVELDKMYAAADASGRGAAYFTDCTLDYDFRMNSDIELCITYTVKSSDSDAFYSVSAYYTMFDEGEYSFEEKRGDVRGYYFNDIKYPGSGDAITIYDIAEYAKLGLTEENTLYQTARALILNDVEALENACRLEKGTLDTWEGMLISEYSLTRTDTSNPFADELNLTMTVEKSPLEGYPAGEYRVTLVEGIAGPVLSFDGANVPGDGADYESGSAEEWVYIWANSCGGWYDILEMTPANDDYAHMMLHFITAVNYMHGEPEAMKTGEDFKRLRAIYFPDGNIPSSYDAKEDVTNCAHGGISRLCSVNEAMVASGIHIVNVKYFADPMRSVTARELRVTLSELGDGQGYGFSNVEVTYESGLPIYGWSS